MSMTIRIPDVPPSQNKWNRLNYISKGRYIKKSIKEKWLGSKRKNSKKKGYFHNYGFEWQQNHEGYARKVSITFCFNNKIRHDIDNYAFFKPLLDGLVQQGIIKDDNTKAIRTSYKIVLGAKKRETIIELQE